MLERWKKAVVHLECATDSMHWTEQCERRSALMELRKNDEIDDELYDEESLRLRGRDLRYHGTALFISHEERRYLLTARHVVWNEHGAKQDLAEEEKRERRDPLELARYVKETTLEKIFDTIFRVSSLDEVQAGHEQNDCLMSLGCGPSQCQPYTFSDPSLDLALISLDQRHSYFADELVSRGYVPIPSTDIANGPDAEGQEVLAIGFPSSTALVGKIDLGRAREHWSSSEFSLPISSFGRVAMVHPALPYFWADISIYPGNSGGPVIASNRLVGIVSGQATLAVDEAPHIRTRIPFGKIIKAGYVHELIKRQIEKDNH